MIWEQHCLVVVMTTRAMERGRPKCHQYWEMEVGGEATYGQFLVKTVSVETDADYTVTSISVTNKKVSSCIWCFLELEFDVFATLTINIDIKAKR